MFELVAPFERGEYDCRQNGTTDYRRVTLPLPQGTSLTAVLTRLVKLKIRLGIASWDDGSNTAKSVKFTWFDKNGRAARGGEFPVAALPQALEFAIRKGYVSLG